MNLREAAQQALEALEVADSWGTWHRGSKAITALREALADTQDWDEIEALRASLREHMAEIQRLRAAGWHSYYALSEITSPLLVREITRIGTAMSGLRAALAEDVPETNFGNMAQTVDSKESDYVADTGKTSDHFPDANKMVATSQESRQVEPVGYFSINSYGNWEQNESGYGTPLYEAPPKREPLTDEEIKRLYDLLPSKYTLAMFARAVERAHGIGGEE